MCYYRTLRPRGRSHFHFIVLGQDGGIRGRAPQKTRVPKALGPSRLLCEGTVVGSMSARTEPLHPTRYAAMHLPSQLSQGIQLVRTPCCGPLREKLKIVEKIPGKIVLCF